MPSARAAGLIKRQSAPLSRIGFVTSVMLWNIRSFGPSDFTTGYFRTARPAFHFHHQQLQSLNPLDHAAIDANGRVRGSALRLSPVPTAEPFIDGDRVFLFVEVVPAQGCQFTDSEARVDADEQHRSVGLLNASDQFFKLRRSEKRLAAATADAIRWQPDAFDRVLDQQTILQGASQDTAEDYEPALAEPIWGKEVIARNGAKAKDARERFAKTSEYLSTQIFTNTQDIGGFMLGAAEYFF